jgi:hypothetical protein
MMPDVVRWEICMIKKIKAWFGQVPNQESDKEDPLPQAPGQAQPVARQPG